MGVSRAKEELRVLNWLKIEDDMKSAPQRFPTSMTDFDDFETFFESHIAHGFKPKAPFLDQNSTIVSLGSCFAANINQALKAGNFENAVLFDIAETNNSVLAIERLISILTSETRSQRDLDWVANYLRGLDIEFARQTLERADCIILTVGVSLALIDDDGYPAHIEVRKARMLTVADNFIGIKKIATGIRSINPDVPIILTVSPVPLAGTPFPRSNAFAVDCVSKSLLRVAVFYAEAEVKNSHYWPSFEGVRWYSGHADTKFGDADGNPRHIDPELIHTITRSFIKNFCQGASE
jgi:hypothetical protein